MGLLSILFVLKKRITTAASKQRRTCIPRECPTGKMYREHQGSLVPSDSADGLYKRVFFRPFLSPLLNLSNTPLTWHGAPLAAICRAIICLGSMDVHEFENSDCTYLRRLQNLGTLRDRREKQPTHIGQALSSATVYSLGHGIATCRLNIHEDSRIIDAYRSLVQNSGGTLDSRYQALGCPLLRPNRYSGSWPSASRQVKLFEQFCENCYVGSVQ
jgi:hypothetical protein